MKPTQEMLINVSDLIAQYYEKQPAQSVAFGTSGHRGTSLNGSFNEAHIFAIAQALCEYRAQNNIAGTLFIGKDSHALSTPAQMSAIRVFSANGVKVAISNALTPTPLISFAIIEANKTSAQTCDGVVITPSHNPPQDGGFKYNSPNGGPADTNVTAIIQTRANEIIANGLREVKTLLLEDALKSAYVQIHDFITPYVASLKNIVDMEAIKNSGLKVAIDPLGGSSIDVYRHINATYGTDFAIVNEKIDPTFSFMDLDHDGKIRMDCSSPMAMASLVNLSKDFDLAFGNDPDSDRHGIVTKDGLMNPNHYLSVAIYYLFSKRNWSADLKIGKTLVSSSMIDRVANELSKEVYEVPVGFKWFSQGMFDSQIGFGGEESAGASFLQFDQSVWSTDKDGIILNLLAIEMYAKLGKSPSQIYGELEAKFGKAYYQRIDSPATKEQKDAIKNADVEAMNLQTLANEAVIDVFTKASGHPIGGFKVVTQNGWIALRPSGTEDVYKIYAESFLSSEHLSALQEEAKKIVASLI